MKKEILVAGIPRCGTTYLFRSLAGLPQGEGSPKGKELEKLPIMKAHSLAPPNTFGDPWAERVSEHVWNGGKTIFVFGNPILAVVSTVRNRMDRVHAKNCGFHGDLSSVDLFRKDYFNYERMFDTWTSGRVPCPVLAVKYERINDVHKQIERFVGRKVQWLPWRRRRTNMFNIYPNVRKSLETTYGSLRKKVDSAPAIQTWT